MVAPLAAHAASQFDKKYRWPVRRVCRTRIAGNIADLPGTLAWLIGCSNAMNLLDGIGGFACGAGVIAKVTLLLAQ
jgi:UDP-N-acetylmuramyl pentapeptide phosphotransferase/UDP-N-acetylglucosamine-1-phosphate transferase